MEILVTGAAGYIGSVVTEALLERGHAVVALDNLQAGHRQAVHPEARFFETDLADKEGLNELLANHRIDAVVHMAAEALIAESITNPRRFFNANVYYGMNLLEAMLDHGVKKIIFSSTAAVYGEPKTIPLDEEAPKQPINSYGESKLMFERMLAWYYKAYGLKYAALRYFNAAGASENYGEHHDPETHIIPLVLQVALGQRDHITINGTDYDTPDGTCIRDYIHVVDLAEAHVLSLEHLERLRARSYNLGNGGGFSVWQIIETCRQVTNHPTPALPGPRRTGDPARLIADSSHIRRELNWQPKYANLTSIIESAWNWHRRHPQGYKI
jgi:UDP-glucose 4-epimerase